MATSARLVNVQNGIEKNLDGMINRSKSFRSFLQSYVYPKYQNLQRERWMTEGESQNDKWPALNAKYAEWKRRRFAAYDGSGEKMLIATGKLVKSVIGPGPGHYKLIDDKSLTVGTRVDYAKYVAQKRSMFKFKPEDIAEIKRAVGEYIRFANFKKFVGR